jgi:hypothetical protein
MSEITQVTADEQQIELTKIFSDLVAREPEAVLVLAKCGSDLLIRMAGSPTALVRLYTESPPEVEKQLKNFLEVALGKRAG